MDELGVERGGYGLITLHRPALVDDPELLRATVKGLEELARTMPLVFPAHPRTRARLVDLGLLDALERSGVRITAPLGYLASGSRRRLLSS